MTQENPNFICKNTYNSALNSISVCVCNLSRKLGLELGHTHSM